MVKSGRFSVTNTVKQKLRSEKLLQRLNQHPVEKSGKDEAILKSIVKLPVFKEAQNVLIYLPIHGEVDLSNLFKPQTHGELAPMNKKFILPKVKGETTLHLYYVKNLNEVEIGRYNIMEPNKNLQQADPKDIDLAIIPGVVFAKNGHRIGYGKGFYDRLLKKVTCPKVGVAYDFQIVENIAGELHDTPMDMIITESKTYKIHTL
jgi:5-formyltetrahydrofolate cyclo-ligase